MNWTPEQILGLAPDAPSAKAGQGLAVARQWQTLGCDGNAAWGLCQGSGKDPYQTQIDLSEPAFRCSCPSRKFPCKHGLGLFLLLAHQPQTFAEKAPPAWVSEWLTTRTKRAQQKAEKGQAEDKPAEKLVDEVAQARRAAAREAKVTAGLQELELWLRDLVRTGLASAQTRPPQFWERMAARLVDAQAPGAARLVREMGGAAASGADAESWQARLLELAARLQLLLEGYKRINDLPEATQADIRAGIGWTVNQDELLKQAGVRDHWLVIGARVEQEDRLRAQRVWLWGEVTNRAAMILHFAPAQQPLDTSLLTGTKLGAELVFYPSAYGLRALVKERFSDARQAAIWPGYETISAAMAEYAAAIARNPWIERFPVALKAVAPVKRDEAWLLRDADDRVLPLHRRFESRWELLALGGGRPLPLFGEWDGDYIRPLSVKAEDQWVMFS